MKASTMLRIGDIIRKLREDKHWTQKTLSEKSGVHEVQIRRYENNQSLPRDAQLSKIASALGVDKDYFFNQQILDEVRKMDESVSEKPLSPIRLGQNTLDKPITAPANTEYSRTITIDTSIDEDHPFNIIQKKIDNGEKLTKEETVLYNLYVKRALEAMKQSLKKFGETLRQSYSQYYALLNEEGVKEADKQIEQAIERAAQQAHEQSEQQIKLLAKVPEYQKKQDD